MTPELTPDEVARRLDLLAQAEAAARAASSSAEAEALAEQIVLAVRQWNAARWQPYPWQRVHRHPEGWSGPCRPECLELPPAVVPTHGAWLLMGGRGTGKSDGAARYVKDHVEGPPCDSRLPGGHKMLMVAPTQGDAVEVIQGPSGLTTVAPGAKLVGGAGGLSVRFPSGARMRVLGAYTPDDENRLRAAGNNCLVYLEEAAAMRHLGVALQHSGFGLRIGPRPHYVVATTPKPRPEVRALEADPKTIRTWGTTDQAVHLDPEVRATLERKHAGTRLGRQELGGETLGDVEGALWVHEQDYTDPGDVRPGIENDRVKVGQVGWTSHDPDHPAPVAAELVYRTVVGVDPSGTGTGDEAGIIVAGSIGSHGYVLADLSGRMTPDQWARRAVRAYYDFGAEGIALERYGGESAATIIRSVTLDDGRTGATVPILPAPTKVGKRLRAEPVQALYEQHRVHHVGIFAELESQQTAWVPDESPDSPDRLDALVHALTYLLIRVQGGQVASPAAASTVRPSASARPGAGPFGGSRAGRIR